MAASSAEHVFTIFKKMEKNRFSLATLKYDIPSGLVVFLVALPLCLGIALASGAPLFSGIIAGIVGGLVVGAISGSPLGVSGPAAGLAVIVAEGIRELGTNANGDFDMMIGFKAFLVAGVIAGIIQIILGILRAGIIGYYFPSSVIKGMLAGIGITLILKQIPHALGWDKNPEGDWAFYQSDGHNTFSEIGYAFQNFTTGAVLITIFALAILILFQQKFIKKNKILSLIPGPLIAVVGAILINELFKVAFPELVLVNETATLGEQVVQNNHLVNIKAADATQPYYGLLTFPDWSILSNPRIYMIGFTMAVVASLETLLCVEATDKLDPQKRVTPTNRELFAQGTGNVLSGLIGGLPITQVIVRSSANIQSGGKSKMSAIIHGFLLLISIIIIPRLLNMIPLSVLAAILFMVGYKLAKPQLFKKMYDLGWKQFVPFTVTVLGIIFIDLLYGIGLGLLVGIVVILIKSYQNSHFLHIEDKSNGKHKIKMTLAEEVTFFNKGAILKELESLPRDTYLELDVRKTRYLDNDIIEILDDFAYKAKERNIDIQLISERGVIENPPSFIEFFKLRPKTA